ncbi:ABC transporter ATP-binding protein [Ekhidna sp. MALMAid0563]|uniref:ABC transporter ATP-binding protein n=1 Tax=Ekhidna sp. MALMAid0563 TaxID=3143937 RepID=UPI0032DED6C5
MAKEPIVTVRNLVKAFGSFRAVDNISFDVFPGEIFGFLGANGAGKSTAIKMLIGLWRPSSGQATIAGFDIYRDTEKIKKSIGYMSQKFSLYTDLTIRENIRLFGGIYGLDRASIKRKTEELLDQLQMQKYATAMIHDLPLGWKQKLAFSVAMIHEPKIIFLDEPTGGVDPITRRQFWELIYAAAAQGTTIFVTTHYMDEAEYCDRISMMVNGKIAGLGTPDELKTGFDSSDMDEVFIKIAREGEVMI